MGGNNPDLSAESLLGIAKYIIEILNPNHKLATRNFQEVIDALKHDFRIRRLRLKCVAVPQTVIRSLMSTAFSGDVETFAVVGLKAAITLGVPVGGSSLGIAFKCICPLTSQKDCGPRCVAPNQVPKNYLFHIASNRNVPEYQLLVSETLFHNIKNSLYGLSFYTDKILTLCVKQCDNFIDQSRLSLKVASKAVISWIEQPQDTDESVFISCLSGFFKFPRHLHKGDVFKVELSDYAPEVLLAPGKFASHDMYFIVKSIEGPIYRGVRNSGESLGYLIIKGETSLVQDVNSHGFLPCTIMSKSSTLEKSIPIYPEGLRKVYNKFISGLVPFLKGTSRGLRPAFLVTGPAGCGKRRLVSSAAAQLGINFWTLDCAQIRGTTSGQTVGKIKAVMSKAKQYAPCVFYMSNIQSLCKDQDGFDDFRVVDEFQQQLSIASTNKFPMIVVGTSPSATELTNAFARIFLLEIPIVPLEKQERKIQLMQFISQLKSSATDDCLEQVVSRSSGFLLGDLAELVALAVRNNLFGRHPERLPTIGTNQNIMLSFTDFEGAIDKMHSAYAGSIGAPKIPSVKWNDVGGLENVKKEILQTVTMPLKHPELTAGGLGRSGILLYGPPGTGKTLLAKAVATECNLNFLSVKGPELLNMYVGQSEANVREIFERAREASPCIIFFDELDALAPNRGRSGDSGGVMDRVVSQLLSEMDGINKSCLLFVIGATNRPDLIDPALLRPGRFDKLLYVGAYEDSASKFSVLSALTRKFKLSGDVDLKEISNRLPSEVTGADMYAVCSGAWFAAVRRVIKQNENEAKTVQRSCLFKGTQKLSKEVEVRQDDFNRSVSNLVLSVSAEDMLYFKGLQQQMSAVPAK